MLSTGTAQKNFPIMDIEHQLKTNNHIFSPFRNLFWGKSRISGKRVHIYIYKGVGVLFADYTPRKLCLWWGKLFSRCPCVRPCVRPSVTFFFFNNLKSQCLIFIKPCKHVHICNTNTLDKKIRARGQFY